MSIVHDDVYNNVACFQCSSPTRELPAAAIDNSASTAVTHSPPRELCNEHRSQHYEAVTKYIIHNNGL